MFATCTGVTPSLPSGNPNASQMDEKLVQLTRTDRWMIWMAGHDDNTAQPHTLQAHFKQNPQPHMFQAI